MWRLMLASALLLLGAALARDARAQARHVGIKAGFSITSLAGDDAAEFTRQNGFLLGGTARFQLGPRLSLQSEVLYMRKGAELTGGSLNLDYIGVPVLARVILTENAARVLPFALVGPAIGFLARCAALPDGASSRSCDGLFEVTPIDYAIVIGGGVSARAGRGALSLELRADLGLNSIDDLGVPDDVKNRAYSVLAGYAVPVGPQR